MRRNPQARALRKAKLAPGATDSYTASPPKPACSKTKIPTASPDLVDAISEKFHPRDTDEDFYIERMAKARWRYNRIMPIEAGIFNLPLSVDQAPTEIIAALGLNGQRAWA
jgi:hypothetical protein